MIHVAWELVLSSGARARPLTRRNRLLNQVEFLGLVHTFTTASPSNTQTFYAKPAPQGYRYSSRDRKKLLLQGKCYINNYQSCYLIGPYDLGNEPRKFDSIYQTCFSPGGTHRLGIAWSTFTKCWKCLLPQLNCNVISNVTWGVISSMPYKQNCMRTLTQWLAYLLKIASGWRPMLQYPHPMTTPTEASV